MVDWKNEAWLERERLARERQRKEEQSWSDKREREQAEKRRSEEQRYWQRQRDKNLEYSRRFAEDQGKRLDKILSQSRPSSNSKTNYNSTLTSAQCASSSAQSGWDRLFENLAVIAAFFFGVMIFVWLLKNESSLTIAQVVGAGIVSALIALIAGAILKLIFRPKIVLCAVVAIIWYRSYH